MNQYANDFTDTVRIYYNDLKRTKPMARAKEKRLLRLSKKGNIKARNEILEANLRFVFDTAKRYSGRGVSMGDLISEGNMGLIKAIEKFDIDNDVKFISYAVWWIRHSMLEAIRRKKTMDFVEIEPATSNDEVMEKKLADEDDESVSMGDTSYSDEIYTKQIALQDKQNSVIEGLMANLNKREASVINHSFGLNGVKKMTLIELGEEMGLSSERVRQIKLGAIRKLRSSMMLCEDMEEMFG